MLESEIIPGAVVYCRHNGKTLAVTGLSDHTVMLHSAGEEPVELSVRTIAAHFDLLTPAGSPGFTAALLRPSFSAEPDYAAECDPPRSVEDWACVALAAAFDRHDGDDMWLQKGVRTAFNIGEAMHREAARRRKGVRS